MSDDAKYVATDHVRDLRDLDYVLTVLTCIDNFVNGKQSYPSLSDARYALNEARNKARRVRDSLGDCDND